ncbi:FapA family protein [Helicobacter mesocricetorum]|uniref:FapA family protein n=1 Tax=Helicobacter mesocricetorum TaxID=87012 RepID=UPI000CF0F649|nr:FapA family protein [Helicobacter mesocricetorum]
MLNKKLSSTFRPYYVNECEDIKFAIKQVASQFNKDPNTLDFDLQSITTYKKTSYDHQIQLIPPNEVNLFLNNRNNLLDPNLTITQRYCILIKEQAKQQKQFHFQADKIVSEVFLIFRAGFTHTDANFESLYQEIRKIKAWNKILFFNEFLEKKALKEFLISLQYPLKQEIKYLLAQGTNLLPTIESKLEFKKEITQNFQTINKDEIICIYHKALQGKPGRNARGEYIIPEEPKTLHQNSPLKYDNASIKPKEYPNAIYYLSAMGGILQYDKDYLQIKDTFETKEVSLKTTGSLIGGIDSGTIINITESDSLKESLGQGMKVEASKVNITGNIGAYTEIKAKEVNIGGFTHQSSKIYTQNATIKTHKGYLYGEIIKIENLETGIVEGKIVEIEQMYGGKVYAQEIIIQNLHSNAFLYATKSIRVTAMEKGENKFFIAANYSPQAREYYKTLIKKKNDSIQEAITLTKELKTENAHIQKLKPTADEIRKTLILYKNTKTTPPSYLLKEFEAYHQLILNLKQKREKINQLSQTYKQSLKDLNAFDEATQEATIEIQSGWVGYNEVHYRFYAPKLELMLIPKPSQPKKVAYDKQTKQLTLQE